MGLPQPVELALWMAGRPATGMDLAQFISEASRALPAALGVRSAVVMVLEPSEVHGSDSGAVALGTLQQRAAGSPLHAAVRSGETSFTPDLGRVAVPGLAAAAKEWGIVSAGSIALRVDDRTVGGLQLLGTAQWAVSEWHLDTVAPVAQVLAARLADIADRHRLTVAFAAEQAAHRRSTQVAQATGILSERRRTDLADAMRHLESQAQRSGSSLVDAAAAILAETSAAPVRIPMQRVDLPPTIEPPRHRRRPA